jgi:hypothetical protein
LEENHLENHSDEFLTSFVAMDMSGMDMSGMSGMGMDSGSASTFQPTNMWLARTYWYLIVAAVGFGLFVNMMTRGNEFLRFVSCFVLQLRNPGHQD